MLSQQSFRKTAHWQKVAAFLYLIRKIYNKIYIIIRLIIRRQNSAFFRSTKRFIFWIEDKTNDKLFLTIFTAAIKSAPLRITVLFIFKAQASALQIQYRIKPAIINSAINIIAINTYISFSQLLYYNLNYKLIYKIKKYV